jgi:hypothetical protein
LTKAKLIEACIRRFGGEKSYYEVCDNEALIQRLSTHQYEPGYASHRVLNHLLEGTSEVRLRLLRHIVKSLFMPKLTAKGREYCKMGQNLELPFAKMLLKQSKLGLTKFPVEQIYRVGLVGKEGELYAKASCDFIAGALIGGEKILVGVECKAWVTPGTQQRERAHAEYPSCFPLATHSDSTEPTWSGTPTSSNTAGISSSSMTTSCKELCTL